MEISPGDLPAGFWLLCLPLYPRLHGVAMTISPEAVQAALETYIPGDFPFNELTRKAMQAALAAAFPIMLREVAKLDWLDSYTDQQINEIADSFSEGDGAL